MGGIGGGGGVGGSGGIPEVQCGFAWRVAAAPDLRLQALGSRSVSSVQWVQRGRAAVHAAQHSAAVDAVTCDI